MKNKVRQKRRNFVERRNFIAKRMKESPRFHQKVHNGKTSRHYEPQITDWEGD